MKVSAPIRQIYQEHHERCLRLQEEIKNVLKPKAEEKGWFFNSRVKGEESFALKVETGRVEKPSDLEDFYGCTLIVPTYSDIPKAEQLVYAEYDAAYRRPEIDEKTHKTPSDFVFDDLRLYVRRRPSIGGRETDLDGVLFEVQIKTVLQYAWGIATHDLVYKSSSAEWPLSRIAYQVKAMLEHAEVAISEAKILAEAKPLNKTNERLRSVNEMIALITTLWPQDQLPDDVKRLGETFFDVATSLDLDVLKVSNILKSEVSRTGQIAIDLSPYAFLVQALAHTSIIDLASQLRNAKRKIRLVVHSGMDLPPWMLQNHQKILRI